MYANGTSYHVPVSNRDRNPEAADRTQLGKDAFMKLLVAQLANQDPTQPVDSHAFVAQLAQFSSVELLQGLGNQLDHLLLATTANNQAMVVQFTGKEVVFASNEISFEEGGPHTLHGKLAKDAASVTVTVKDEAGNVVRTLQLGAHSAGDNQFEWDGLDDRGNPAKSGKYKIEITAADAEGNAVDVHHTVRARVDGVSFANGYPELIIGSLRITLADVVEIHAT